MELAIYNLEGQDTGRKAQLSDEVFAIEPNEHAVYLAVKQFLANQRQGTHKSKERSEVAGSTRKLHKQKGGGGSRVGDINSPVMGGGRVFGPRPRDYRFKLNKKLRDLARRSALTYKAQDQQLTVVEDFTFAAPKTKDYVKMAKALKVDGKKVLVLLAQKDENFYLSARNVPNTRVMTATDLNTYALMNSDAVVLTTACVDILNNL